jgi:ankyrin repeat protein
MTVRSGDASWVQTFLSAPDVQTYINYTDKDGRTPLLYTSYKGHDPIVEKLIPVVSNINLGQTMDGTSPLLIASQRTQEHARVFDAITQKKKTIKKRNN